MTVPSRDKRGKGHWAVLMRARHLERTDARYHEWAAPGVTVCGRKWYIAGYGMRISALDEPYVWVARKNAEKFAQPCKRCYP